MRLDLVFIYLAKSFFYRLMAFFVHWYGHTFRIISSGTVGALEKLEMFWAVRKNWKNIFHPLSFVRVVSGLAVYGAITGIAIFVFVVWSLIPVYLVLRIFINP